MMRLELPYPPSINHYWRRVGPRTLISREGRRFRREVTAILAASGVRPLSGRLAVRIDVFPPDRRRRDLDNILKSLLDALEHGSAFHNDSQIDALQIRRCEVVPQGMVRVTLKCPGNDEEEPAEPAGPRDPRRQARPRTCLKCRQTFDSAHAGNRICPRCARINNGLRVTERELQTQRGRKWHNGEPMDDGERC